MRPLALIAGLALITIFSAEGCDYVQPDPSCPTTPAMNTTSEPIPQSLAVSRPLFLDARNGVFSACLAQAATVGTRYGNVMLGEDCSGVFSLPCERPTWVGITFTMGPPRDIIEPYCFFQAEGASFGGSQTTLQAYVGDLESPFEIQSTISDTVKLLTNGTGFSPNTALDGFLHIFIRHDGSFTSFEASSLRVLCFPKAAARDYAALFGRGLIG